MTNIWTGNQDLTQHWQALECGWRRSRLLQLIGPFLSHNVQLHPSKSCIFLFPAALCRLLQLLFGCEPSWCASTCSMLNGPIEPKRHQRQENPGYNVQVCRVTNQVIRFIIDSLILWMMSYYELQESSVSNIIYWTKGIRIQDKTNDKCTEWWMFTPLIKTGHCMPQWPPLWGRLFSKQVWNHPFHHKGSSEPDRNSTAITATSRISCRWKQESNTSSTTAALLCWHAKANTAKTQPRHNYTNINMQISRNRQVMSTWYQKLPASLQWLRVMQ